MSKRAKCVTINQKEYDSEIFLSRFEKIKHKLKEALNDPTLSTKALAQATGQWILFQDDQFGRYVRCSSFADGTVLHNTKNLFAFSARNVFYNPSEFFIGFLYLSKLSLFAFGDLLGSTEK